MDLLCEVATGQSACFSPWFSIIWGLNIGFQPKRFHLLGCGFFLVVLCFFSLSGAFFFFLLLIF